MRWLCAEQVIFVAALVITLGLLAGFLFTMAPLAVSALQQLPFLAITRSDVMPWVATAVLALLLCARERRARKAAERAATSVNDAAFDNVRADTYPAK